MFFLVLAIRSLYGKFYMTCSNPLATSAGSSRKVVFSVAVLLFQLIVFEMMEIVVSAQEVLLSLQLEEQEIAASFYWR